MSSYLFFIHIFLCWDSSNTQQPLVSSGSWKLKHQSEETGLKRHQLRGIIWKYLSSNCRRNICVFHEASSIFLQKNGGNKSVFLSPSCSEWLIDTVGFSRGAGDSRAVVRWSRAPGDHAISWEWQGWVCADPLYDAGQTVQTGNEAWFSAAWICKEINRKMLLFYIRNITFEGIVHI